MVLSAILTSLPDPQGSAGVVSVMVAAAGGCWAAIQLYQVVTVMMTMIMNLNRRTMIMNLDRMTMLMNLDRIGLIMIGFGQNSLTYPHPQSG